MLSVYCISLAITLAWKIKISKVSTEGKCPDLFSLLISGIVLGPRFHWQSRVLNHIFESGESLHAWLSIAWPALKFAGFTANCLDRHYGLIHLSLSPHIGRITEHVPHTTVDTKWLYRIKSSIINSKIKSMGGCERANVHVQLCAISTFCRSDN